MSSGLSAAPAAQASMETEEPAEASTGKLVGESQLVCHSNFVFYGVETLLFCFHMPVCARMCTGARQSLAMSVSTGVSLMLSEKSGSRTSANYVTVRPM